MKKNIIKNIFFALVALFSLAACENRELITIDNQTNPILVDFSAERLVLDKNFPNNPAFTISWKAASYTIPTEIRYKIEVSATESFATKYVLGNVAESIRTATFTAEQMNKAAEAIGLAPNVSARMYIRVSAFVGATSQNLVAESNKTYVMVTPYVAYVNLFLVGDATAAGWNPDNDNQALFRDPAVTSKFYFTGKFGTSMFKLLEVLGQWQPQWGLKGGTVANSDGGDPDPFGVSTAGYYTFTVDINAKTYSLVPFTGSTSTTYTTLGLIGSATSNGWGGDTFMTKSTFDPHLWVKKGVTLTAGEAKFRANSDWGINWGANTEVSGQGTSGGPNIPVSEAGTYDVYFNDLDGRYLFIKR